MDCTGKLYQGLTMILLMKKKMKNISFQGIKVRVKSISTFLFGSEIQVLCNLQIYYKDNYVSISTIFVRYGAFVKKVKEFGTAESWVIGLMNKWAHAFRSWGPAGLSSTQISPVNISFYNISAVIQYLFDIWRCVLFLLGVW